MKPLIVMFSMLAGMAQAGQPISESLVECSWLVQLSASGFDDQTRPEVQALDSYAEGFWRLAMDQARSEGRSLDDLSGFRQAKMAKWGEAATANLVFSEDYKDWMAYCRSLGKSRGLTIARPKS